MAIVPVYPRLMQYFTPMWPVPYPTVHPHIHWRPMIMPHFFHPTISQVTYQYSYSDSDSIYYHKLINATYNPGNFWVWPPGQ